MSWRRSWPASVDTVVDDAGPLIALARVDCIRHFPAPFGRGITVPMVRAEVAPGSGCSEAARIEGAIAGAIEVEQPPADGASLGLGPGETDALRLALTLGFGFVPLGKNRRVPVDFDGLRLVSFLPPDDRSQAP